MKAMAAVTGVALMGMALSAWTVFAQDERERLCHNGRPIARAAGITYGGKPVIHGYERDHVIPLSLGGADIADNVKYQRCDRWGPRGCAEGPAAIEDEAEHAAVRDFCRGKATLSEARERVAKVKAELQR